jgi:hypothetical protein
MIPPRQFFCVLVLMTASTSNAAPLAPTAWDGAAIATRSGPFGPTLPEIQANVFTPSCALSFCHGQAMQANLDLREGASFTSLVGVPSVEVPDRLRVEPFKPDDSYLICKLENCSWVVGNQMPIIDGPLPQETIDVIRQWITLGALEFPSVSVEGNSWGRVKALYRN